MSLWKDSNNSFNLTRVFSAAALLWTLAISLSLAWNIFHVKEGSLQLATIQARSSFDKDILYRRWVIKHGGVYVPVTEDTQPNPYLSDVPERDVRTPSGRLLTLMNSAYMIREVEEIAEGEGRVSVHIVSLKPIHPRSGADPWELEALAELEKGKSEVLSLQIMKGSEHMRLLRPLATEIRCLKCHEENKEGDVRGGISISVPMEPFRVAEKSNIFSLIVAHSLLWLIGIGGIAYAGYRIRMANETLQESEERYRAIVEDQTELISRFLPDGTITFVNKAYCRYFGESEDDLIGSKFWHHVPVDDQERFKGHIASFGPERTVSTIEHRWF